MDISGKIHHWVKWSPNDLLLNKWWRMIWHSVNCWGVLDDWAMDRMFMKLWAPAGCSNEYKVEVCPVLGCLCLSKSCCSGQRMLVVIFVSWPKPGLLSMFLVSLYICSTWYPVRLALKPSLITQYAADSQCTVANSHMVGICCLLYLLLHFVCCFWET